MLGCGRHPRVLSARSLFRLSFHAFICRNCFTDISIRVPTFFGTIQTFLKLVHASKIRHKRNWQPDSLAMFVFVVSTQQIFWVTMHMIVCASYDHIINILRRGTHFPPCSVVYQTQAKRELWLTGSIYNWYTQSWQPQICSHAETANQSIHSLVRWHRNTTDAEELVWEFWVYLEPVWMRTLLHQPYCAGEGRKQQRCMDMLKDPGQTLCGFKRK